MAGWFLSYLTKLYHIKWDREWIFTERIQTRVQRIVDKILHVQDHMCVTRSRDTKFHFKIQNKISLVTLTPDSCLRGPRYGTLSEESLDWSFSRFHQFLWEKAGLILAVIFHKSSFILTCHSHLYTSVQLRTKRHVLGYLEGSPLYTAFDRVTASISAAITNNSPHVPTALHL